MATPKTKPKGEAVRPKSNKPKLDKRIRNVVTLIGDGVKIAKEILK